MQVFSAEATIFKRFFLIVHENMKNRPRKVLRIGPKFFFGSADRPETNPNINFYFYSIKIAHHGTYV